MSNRPGIKACRTVALVVVLVAMLAAALTVLGCQSQPAAPAAPTAAPAAPAKAAAAPTAPVAPAAPTAAPAAPATAAPASQETLKVGIAVAMSGPGVTTGQSIDRFTRMAIDELNAKGGIKAGGKTYRVEAVTADDKATAEGALEATNRLVLAEKVKTIFGYTGYSPAAAAQTVTEPNKVILALPSLADQQLGPKFPFSFNLGTPPIDARAALLTDWLKQEYPNVKRLGFLAYDQIGGRDQVDRVAAAAEAKGLTLTGKEFYITDLKDFAPVVTRVLRQNPDALYIVSGAFTGPFLGLMQGLNEQGFKGPKFSMSVGTDMATLEKNSAFLDGYTWSTIADFRSAVVSPDERQIIERYIQKYGEAGLSVQTVVTHNNPLVVAQAMEKAGTVGDTEKIAKTLREGEWDTMWSKQIGKSRFTGQKSLGLASTLEMAVYMSRVQSGKVVTFKQLKLSAP